MCYWAHSSAGLLAIETAGVAKAVHRQIHASKNNYKTGSDGWQGNIFSGALMSATLLSPFQCSQCCVSSTQDSFYNGSAIVSAPDSEDGSYLCRCLTPVSLILVVSTSTRRLDRSKKKAYTIVLLPSQP